MPWNSYHKRRRTTAYSANYRSTPQRVVSSYQTTLLIAELKERTPIPGAEYADSGFDLLAVRFRSGRLADVYQATTGKYL